MINIRSSAQLRLLLFGGVENIRNKEARLEKVKEFPAPKREEARQQHSRRFELNSLGLTPSPQRKHFTDSGWPKTAANIVAQLAGNASGKAKGVPGAAAATAQLIAKGYKQEEAERATP